MNNALVPAGAAAGGPPPESSLQTIGNLVRYWVHYDNMLTDLNKQTRQVRDVKKNYEHQILQGLKATHMANPIIQINGGRINVIEEKHHQPLTFKTLETLLHQYYRTKPGKPDETRDIINFIKLNRTTEIEHSLKKTMYTTSAHKDA
jgi:hypothetical protein